MRLTRHSHPRSRLRYLQAVLQCLTMNQGPLHEPQFISATNIPRKILCYFVLLRHCPVIKLARLLRSRKISSPSHNGPGSSAPHHALCQNPQTGYPKDVRNLGNGRHLVRSEPARLCKAMDRDHGRLPLRLTWTRTSILAPEVRQTCIQIQQGSHMSFFKPV